MPSSCPPNPVRQRLRVNRHEFKFGRRLKFRREELHSNLVTIVSGSEGCAAEAHRLWPQCKLDALLEFRGGDYMAQQITCAAEKLMASLFYVDLQCRLPPGPALMDLILRLRAQRSKLSFCGDGPVRVSELCPFLRLVSVRAASPRTAISVKMDGIHPETTGQRLVSNCPRSLQELMAACPGQLPAAWEKPEDDEAQRAATVGRMEKGLCELISSLTTSDAGRASEGSISPINNVPHILAELQIIL